MHVILYNYRYIFPNKFCSLDYANKIILKGFVTCLGGNLFKMLN